MPTDASRAGEAGDGAGLGTPPTDVRPFTLALADEDLVDLRNRLGSARLSSPAPEPDWTRGTDTAYLTAMLRAWAHDYDWRVAERELNRHAHYRVRLPCPRSDAACGCGGVEVHFVWARAREGDGVPLVLTHGWPSTFAEMLPLVPPLTDPRSHGLDGPAFDVVVPSLPGYCFSTRPPHRHTLRDTAVLWHELMCRLGYDRYGAHGGDLGSGVGTFLALDRPEAVVGLHLSNLELDPPLDADAPALTDAERAYLSREEEWAATESGYNAVQSTKPRTLAHALNDSPAGLAAWVLEKWRSWSDSAGDLNARVPRDFLLTTLTLLWCTGSVEPSLLDFYDNRDASAQLGAGARVRVPTGIAVFGNEFVDPGTPPREWAERLYDVRTWTVMPRGGHFAAVEEPRLLAQDIVEFFGSSRRA